MSSEAKQELVWVAGKWNREGPPADTKDRYHTCNQKKVMEDFMGMVRRTMGLHLVILTANDRGEGKAPGTTLSLKQNMLMKRIMMEKGFGSLKLKHRQKVVRTVFQKAYSLITNNPRAPVPWGEVSEEPGHYLDLECIPKNVVIKDPSYLQKDTIATIYSHWTDHASHGSPIISFVGYRQADFYDAPSKKRCARQKSRKKPDYVHVTSDEEDHLKKIDDGKSLSDEDEDNLDIAPIADSSPQYHVTRDMFGGFQTDLKARKQQLPIWVSWTWSQAYLPKDIHENMETTSTALENLCNYKFNSRGWGLIVVLGLGLLLQVDVPDYLGNSILGFELGDQIVDKIAGIEAKVEARRAEERKKLKENQKAEEARVIEEKRVEDEKRAMEENRVEDEKRAMEKKSVEEEARLAEEASKAEKRVRKSNVKGKGKRPAADVEVPSKKKVKSFPPDPPRRSGRDKVTSKKYNA
ncbi:hypothetical protein EDB19DRAFT_1948263 [Suillus lakei]|nr:hypothetical protein EDB19DRAFT_1948263 [Suillus lakei]